MLMFLLTLTIALGISSVFSEPTNKCRCTSESECWPSGSQFQTLASRVSKPLLYPVPPATPCYNSTKGDCDSVLAGWNNGIWRSDQSGAADHPNWETYTFSNGTTEACYLDTSLGIACRQGNVPAIGVDARTASDVQEAVKFAWEHNLRLVIKNTGHDYLGRSSGRGSFLIWTHHMKNITYHKSFTPTGASESVVYEDVFTLGAGVQWFEAYEAAKQHNRVIVGGFSARGSLGAAGGWLSGGGHSAISPNYGLGVDNVLEIAIVTADGNYIIANSYSNEDLFWALRGGGGGTWGVVTSVTYKTHPSTHFSCALFDAYSTNTNSTREIVKEVIHLTPSLVEQGYGGYGGGSTGRFFLIVISPNVTGEQTKTTFRPLFDLATSLPSVTLQNYTIVFQDLWQFNDVFLNSKDGQVGTPTEISSWLLPKDVFETDERGELADELLKLSTFGYYLVTGGQVSRVDPESTGLNPVWRNSLAFVALSTYWQEGANSTEIEAARQQLLKDMKILDNIAPESGSSSNQASRYEFDWKKSFFGTHFEKLRAIKQKYDPESLFLVYEGIGSDEWDADLICQI